MKKVFTHLFAVCTVLFLSSAFVSAQVYEAEDATLTSNAAIVQNQNNSGGAFVEMRDGDLSFTVSTPEEGFYDIYVNLATPSGEKTNSIQVGDVSASFTTNDADFGPVKVLSYHQFSPGEHQVEIINSWGWINIDYIELVPIDASERFNLTQTLVTPEPIPEASCLYQFLLDNYGEKIISGAMTLGSTAESDWIDWIETNTGKEPALLGFDFMHSGRDYNWYDDATPVNDARDWYNRNGIPVMMWHWRDPSKNTEEFYTEDTDFDVSTIFEPQSAAYQAMIDDIDYISQLLKPLNDDGIPLIWRPLHEAAGGWFWWGAQGPEACKELYHIMYDRMVNHHGLNNLIWVWTNEPNDDEWYPGDEYVDIIGRDIYDQGNHTSMIGEFNNINDTYNGTKMIALSENGSFPDPDNLVDDGARWSWFMPWYQDYTTSSEHNSLELWQKTMNHEYVITLDEMPDLRSYCAVTDLSGAAAYEDRTENLKAWPTLLIDHLNIERKEGIHKVEIYSATGDKIKSITYSAQKKIQVPFSGISTGIYLVVIDSRDKVKVIKQ